ncbi:MAG: hypothetical protein OEY44_01165, partial [Candidatus Peregrinibacteria bacterium]|nr:hypothetical protein [Candidatus Peregrinibacteria bacterium]
MENNYPNQSDYQSQPNQPKWQKYLAGIVISAITVATTYLVHTNPQLNMADLLYGGDPDGLVAQEVFMPTYEGGVGEDGLLEIVANDALPDFDSITFAMHYTPVDALEFESNPIVFDGGTIFQDAAFQMTAEPQAGKLIATIILSEPATGVVATDVLFKLNTKLKDSIPVGQVINITFSDLALLNGIDPLDIAPMPATTITVVGQNELKVLNAEAIDETHVAVHFSDYLQENGLIADYNIEGIEGPSGLATNLLESGPDYGFDQKTVVLTLDAEMTPALGYAVRIEYPLSGNIVSNSQGGLNEDYTYAVFYGFGEPDDSLTDFDLVSAKATGYNTIEATFSHPVLESSATKDAFSLYDENNVAFTITNVSSVNGNKVTLTVLEPLVDEYGLDYILDGEDVLRESDGSIIGLEDTAFTGYKNGPRIISANVSKSGDDYKLQITFDENIELEGSFLNNPVGMLYETGELVGTQVDDTNSATYNQVISGKTLTLTSDVFNDPDKNFIFFVQDGAWLQNSLGVETDDASNSVSFWGYGHSGDTIGTPQLVKKDVVRVSAGTLDLNAVEPEDVSFIVQGNDILAFDSVTLVDGALELTYDDVLPYDLRYTLRIVDNPVDDNTLVAKDFVVAKNFKVTGAEAVAAKKLQVNFSDNIDVRDVDETDFEVEGGGIAVNSITVSPDYKSVVLDLDTTLDPGNIYLVHVVNPDEIYSYDGEALSLHTVTFRGFQTLATPSEVELQNVEVLGNTTLRLQFSGAVDADSFTPVNLRIFKFDDPNLPGTQTDLVLTDITSVGSNTFELTTSIQEPLANYFVTFEGVLDSQGFRLGNEKPLNFFGFELPLPALSLVTPSVISNELESNIVLAGQNMDVVEEVRFGSTVMEIVSQSVSSITIKIPAGFEPDLYTITLVDIYGNSYPFENAILLTVPEAELVVHSGQSKSIPFNVPNDGVTEATLWLLVEDPVGLNNISSVVVDLTQVG